MPPSVVSVGLQSATMANQLVRCPGGKSSGFSPGRGGRWQHSLEPSLPGKCAGSAVWAQLAKAASHLAQL